MKIVKKNTPSLKDSKLSPKDIDALYARYEDVEKEISMYDKSIWKDKVVYCNCDNPSDDSKGNCSLLATYFLLNFNELGLKKLICSHYGSPVDLFNQRINGYVFTKTGYKELGGFFGRFDDPLSLKILNEEADIVCTKPPFSRMKDYWDIIIKSGKKFLIISDISNATNTAYFKANKVWAGYNRIDYFLNPKKELVKTTSHWYTNFPTSQNPAPNRR